MASLDAAVEERLGSMNESARAKQRARIRLIADPSITVTSLVDIFVDLPQVQRRKVPELFGCTSPWWAIAIWVA